ncbi:hypothetical protein LZ31DRAFT_345419 [Colletotrichum somersetense]|nr:hypothetical protein LZ31DRAFT_345419 [Colletotrichum somersetense]
MASHHDETRLCPGSRGSPAPRFDLRRMNFANRTKTPKGKGQNCPHQWPLPNRPSSSPLPQVSQLFCIHCYFRTCSGCGVARRQASESVLDSHQSLSDMSKTMPLRNAEQFAPPMPPFLAPYALLLNPSKLLGPGIGAVCTTTENPLQPTSLTLPQAALVVGRKGVQARSLHRPYSAKSPPSFGKFEGGPRRPMPNVGTHQTTVVLLHNGIGHRQTRVWRAGSLCSS